MLGVGVLNPYSAHPVELAMHAATLQELSGGRAILGIAAGAAGFLELAGISQDAPLPRTRQSLLACRALLDGANPAEVEGAGRWGRAARLLSVPAQEVPIYLGAMSPKMLALGGELSDGVLALLFPPEHYPTARGHIIRGRDESHRPAQSVDIPACVWVSVAEDREASGDSPGGQARLLWPRVLALPAGAGGAHSGRLRTGGGRREAEVIWPRRPG